MKTMRWMTCLIIALLFTAASPASGQQQKQPILVGHIDHLEGQLLRYVPETKDWVATVKDAPFGLEDALYADKNTRAEIIMPNSTMLRIGGSTQAQLLRLTDDVTEIDIASGTARFYNNSPNNIIKATTPFGSVVAPASTSFDLYVGDESVEVIGVKGRVEFVHPAGTTKYEVIAGSSSIVANRSQVASGEGMTDASWNSWNTERDRIWEQRLAPRGETVRYLPEQLYTEAYALEDQGSWERVYYDGGYRQFWRPTHVSAGWAPYTCGRWTTWYGDQVWVPAEPFGYVTHHYGSWVYVDASRCWFWAPPVVAVNIAAVPSYTISYGWYPGRVSWIYTETYVGWVPLAPYEPYYCHNYWGPSVIIVGDFDNDHHHGDHHDDNHGRHHYEDHAVVVNQNNFYTVNNYNDVRIKNVDKATIAKAYRGSPVVNSMVIKNHKDLLQKYNFADLNVHQKPHQTVLERIQNNMGAAKRSDRDNAPAILQKTDRIKIGSPDTGATFKGRPFQVTDKMVPASDVAKPRAVTPFATRELKPSGTVLPAQHEAVPQQPVKPSFDRDRGMPEPKRPESAEHAGKPEPPAFNKPAETLRPHAPQGEEGRQPVLNTPEVQKPGTLPGHEIHRPVPPTQEQIQRPEHTRPQINDDHQPAHPEPRVEQPRQVEPPVRHEPQIEQPRTIQQPRQVTPEPRQQPTVSKPETHTPVQTQTEQPRHIEPPVRHEPQVEQPRTIQQPRQVTPEPRQQPAISRPETHAPTQTQTEQPRHIEQPVRHEPQVQQPREVTPQPQHQPAYSQPETHTPVQQSPSGGHQQTAPKPSQPQSQQLPGAAHGFQR